MRIQQSTLQSFLLLTALPPSTTAFEYTNMPPPINVGDNPMYVGSDKLASSGPPSSQNTLSRQFMNPLYDYDEDEGNSLTYTHTLSVILYLSPGDATVLTNPKTKQ